MPTIANATITDMGSYYEVKPNNGYVLYDITTVNDEYQIYSYIMLAPKQSADYLANIIAVAIEDVPADAIICGNADTEEVI